MWSVFFVFLSYLDRNVVEGALDTEKESEQMMLSTRNGTFCAKMSMVGENFLYQVSDGAEVVRSVVSPAGKLVNCSITVTHIQVKSFMQECRMLGMKARPDAPFTHMDQVRSMCREFTQRMEGAKTDASDGFEVQDKTLRRSKRGFTYPGTLWCGAGNMADNYEQLGHYAETDSCCRIHDHCPHVIHAFSSNYGYTNFKWHSICHCDCDNALKACLRKVNDTSSRIVGQAFFNVIGVPCFDLVYEEQCSERHWYGMCKRYKQLPIAVLRDAVPYDFGGIDVIDELTMSPPHLKDSKNSNGEEIPENPTQSTTPGPEEPSLRNVVTAAEDFIKVLATVSTSQSSNAESDKSEEQRSEKKKKRKNSGKNKKTSKKPKGKGRKRKQKAGVKREEGAVVSPSGSKADHMKTLSNFISESHRREQSSTNSNRAGDSEFELEGKDEPSNEVMKDEPAMDEQTVTTAAAITDLKSPAELELDMATEDIPLPTATTTVTLQKAKNRRQRKGKNSKTHLRRWGQLAVTPTEKVSAVSVHTNITITTTGRPQQQSPMETQLVVSTAGPSTVIPKVKRNRSKKGGDREKRKNRRRGSSASPLDLSAPQNSSVDHLEAALFTGAPTIPSIPISARQHSPAPHVYSRGTVQTAALNPSFSILKRQRSREKTMRKRRRKTLTPPPSENSSIPLNSSENVPQIPDTRVALKHSESTTATLNEWRPLPTAALTVVTERHRQEARRQTKPRRKAGDTGQTQPVTFTAKPLTAAAVEVFRSDKAQMTTLSPIRWTIERVKAQFARKKRRKAAMLKKRMA